MGSRTAVTSFLMCCFSSLSFCQVPLGVPRTNPTKITVSVRVKFQDDRPITTAAEVQLLSMTGDAVTETFTHADGRVEFPDIGPGIYRIKVSGANIETTTSDSFDIGDNDRTHSEIVHVSPVRPSSASEASGPGTISAQQLNVPDKARKQMEKGMEAFAQGDSATAAQNMEKAIEIFPSYTQAYYNLGVIRVKQGDRNAARAAFEKSIATDDHFVLGYVSLARLMVATQEAEGTSMVEKALVIDPNNLEGLALLARLQFNKGEFAQALATVSRVHALPHEHFAEVHLIAAEIYQKSNRNAEAVAQSEIYLQEYPDSPRAALVRDAVAQIQARR